MTADEQALLAAVLADPGDDTPRLVYADWLDEHATQSTCESCNGSGEQSEKNFHGAWDTWKCLPCGGSGFASDDRRERAEFIRVQCELAATDDPHGDRYWDGQLGDGPGSYRRRKALRRRERELWHALPTRIVFAPFASGIVTKPSDPWFWLGDQTGPELVVRRGFVESITCSWEQWSGGECENCGGDGDLYYMGGDEESPCPDCSGTGHVPGLADRLYWREEVECPGCKGRGWYDRQPGDGEMSCYHCSGTGCVRNPDPPPPTAQPIRKVDLRSTSWWWHSRRNDGVEVTSGSARYMCQRAKWGEAHTVLDILKIEWPGVTFEWAAPNPTS